MTSWLYYFLQNVYNLSMELMAIDFSLHTFSAPGGHLEHDRVVSRKWPECDAYSYTGDK